MSSTLLRLGLGALAGALREMPKNDSAFTYDIIGFDNSQYLTRTLLPRFGARRVILHALAGAGRGPLLQSFSWGSGLASRRST